MVARRVGPRQVPRAFLAITTISIAFTIAADDREHAEHTLPVASKHDAEPNRNTASAPREQQDRAQPVQLGGSVRSGRSGGDEDAHAPGLLALAAGPDLELDLLALLEAAVAVALDGREVHEHVARRPRAR